MKHRLSMKPVLLLVSLTLLIGLGIYIYGHSEKEEQEENAGIELWQTVGFLAKGNPETSASGINAYSDEDGNMHYDVYLHWNRQTELEIVCDADVTVTIGQQTYHGGDSISVPDLEYLDGEISARGRESLPGQFRFISTYGLPSVFLGSGGEGDAKEFVTEGKGNTATGYCMVLDEEGRQDYLGLCGIRVHGNTSWFDEKKSYQFNLDSPSEILGMSSQRKWILDSEYDSSALLCDAVMYELSRKTGDSYGPDFRFVNVFFDGQYEGLYLLVQKISIEGGTLSDLKDLESINNKLQGKSIGKDVSGGYLVELLGLLGMQEVDESLHVETLNRWMRVRSPNNINEDQHAYLEELVNEAEEALYLPDGETTSSGKIWSDYFDKESWIRQYVLQEISANTDTDNCSQYFYVNENERVLYGGPAWDFDRSLKHFFSNERLNYVQRCLHNSAVKDTAKNDYGILWLRRLDMHHDFHEAMKEYYFEVAEPQMQAILDEDVPAWIDLLKDPLMADSIRWNYDYGNYIGTMLIYQTGFSERIKFLHEYYRNEDDYCLLTFNIPMRLLLVIPVKKGETIGEDILPLYDWCDEWYCDGELFTLETVVTHDMNLTLAETKDDETLDETEEGDDDGTD